jgi:subtilisin family serine protease
MRPRSNSFVQSSLYWLVLLIAVALALSAITVLWSTLPVQAQSESGVNDTGDAQPTGKHLIAFTGNEFPQDYDERISALGGTVEANYPEIGVAVANGLTEDAAERLRSFKDVQVVEQDVERQWLEPVAEEALAEDASSEVAPASPNNPDRALRYARQWNMRAIKADKAWNARPKRLGSENVKVAILDTGIDYTNPDLQERVDLNNSTSFVPSDDALVQTYFPGRHPSTDLNFHGTHVAATVSSNGVVAAGVTSKVNLMAVKVLDANGSGPLSGVLGGIMYAADHGADVINMSLESSFSKNQKPGLIKVFNRAINYANRKGSVFVVSAGNDSSNMDADSNLYQAYCQSPHVVCVSATGPTSQASVNGPWQETDSPASYSNFGAPVTVAAPGGNRDTEVWAVCSQTSLVVPVCRTGNFVVGLKGTSMAAPHVSGLAALVVEDIGKGRPSQVAAQVRESADDLGDPDKDVYYGYGRINVAKALNLEGT